MTVTSGPSPGPADTPPPPRGCPRCGHPLRAAQDWCLHCGAAVTTHIVSPPAWRGPLVAMLGVLVLALAALVLAFFALADDDPAADPIPTPGLATPTATPSPGATATPAPSPAAQAPADWPAGESAWTIILDSTSSRAAARKQAENFAGQGLTVGVLRSDDFASLPAGSWLVFSGQYESARAAARAQKDLATAPASAYVQRIRPS